MFSETDAYPENCKKCTKPKYHIKHKNYCEIKCNTIMVRLLKKGAEIHVYFLDNIHQILYEYSTEVRMIESGICLKIKCIPK